MSLKEKLVFDMQKAMKGKDKESKELLTTIRLINAMIQNEEIKLKTKLDDSKVLEILNRELKQTNESLEAYQGVRNAEKVQVLENRIIDIKKYLPQQLTDNEIKDLITSIINSNGIEGKKDKGKLMGLLMPQVKGKADGRLVNKMVEDLLG